jgi:hypothetical protein
MSAPQSKAKSLFLNAVELPTPAQRRAYLDGQCGGDAALRLALPRKGVIRIGAGPTAGLQRPAHATQGAPDGLPLLPQGIKPLRPGETVRSRPGPAAAASRPVAPCHGDGGGWTAGRGTDRLHHPGAKPSAGIPAQVMATPAGRGTARWAVFSHQGVTHALVP